MDTGQNVTNVQTAPPAETEPVTSPEHLKYLQNEWITFCAASGISMTEDGEFVTMSVTQFADAAKVSRQTLYRWRDSIPNFWSLVDQRAKEIFNQSTKYAIFKGLKLKAMTGDVKAAEMVLSHYSDYTPPAQKHEVKLSGWGDMVREARKRQIKQRRPVEAEVIPPVAPPSTNPPNPLPTEPAISTPAFTPSSEQATYPHNPQPYTQPPGPAPPPEQKTVPPPGGPIAQPNQPIII